MKKVKVFVGILAFMGLAVLNYTQSERSFISKALASSDGDSSNSSAPVFDHTEGRGYTDPRCPIWAVTYSFETDPKGEVSAQIYCTSGGVHKCLNYRCPHGS